MKKNGSDLIRRVFYLMARSDLFLPYSILQKVFVNWVAPSSNGG